MIELVKTLNIMFKFITIAATLALVLPAHSQTAAQQISTLLKQGQAAEAAGDPVAAGKSYAAVLKLDPKNPDARYSIGQLRINSAALSAKGREAKFGSVMIPNYQLDEATLKESLDALSKFVEKESKEQVTPNFVIDDKSNKFAEKKISLNLKNMPSRAVLKYLLEQTGGKARYDEHAIVISPR